MTSDSFLWLNLAFASLMAFVFVIGRNRLRAPSRLNLKNNWSRGLTPKSAPGSFTMSSETIREAFSGSHVKSLNVIFMYNGHNWDAHEVLGVPAGCRWEQVELAYQAALKNSAPETHEFLQTAYHAIRSS
jgi:hypothetical protein